MQTSTYTLGCRPLFVGFSLAALMRLLNADRSRTLLPLWLAHVHPMTPAGMAAPSDLGCWNCWLLPDYIMAALSRPLGEVSSRAAFPLDTSNAALTHW